MATEYRSLCKDCGNEFGYSEASLLSGSTRGLSRPERCPNCRRTHSKESRTIGIPQISLKPKGPRKPDSELTPGRLGRIYHPERFHKKVEVEGKFKRLDSPVQFGITDNDIRLLIEAMKKHQVTVVVGPTGSGKSTFLPYRLMSPPEGIEPDIFTRYGQIVVTQPRTQATRNIAKFVAEDLHGCSLGAGFDVGFRHKDAPASDWRNKLVYVTDGTLINWIVSGQICNLSVIMIDEAHERSLNIDLILGLLKKQLPRYPHLKLIIASATINAKLFQDFYGGPDKVALLKFRGLKQHQVDAYFPDHDFMLKNDRMVPDHMARKVTEILEQIASGRKPEGDILGFLTGEEPIERCVALLRQAVLTNAKLRNRGVNIYPLYSTLPLAAQDKALAKKTRVIKEKVIDAVKSTKTQGTMRMVALLLDQKSVEETAELIRKALNDMGEAGWVVTLINPDQISFECHPRQIVVTTHEHYPSIQGESFDLEISDRRVVISTNVAETSLTVDGIVYVVDSGLINQASWDSEHSARELTPIFHSRAGCRQRMGRAGRVRNGEAHLLYTDEQFEDEEVFPPHTIPEIQRSSLEQVVLKAKAAGIHDLKNFDWIQPPPEGEIDRVLKSIGQMGAIDEEGDLTHYGVELNSYTTEVPMANLLIVADQFACGVEMATLAAILSVRVFGGLLQWNRDWDFTTREQVDLIHRRFTSFCRDDLELYLKIYSLYAEASNDLDRDYFCRSFFIDRELMENKVLPTRKKLLEMLSVGKKGEEDRTINFDLLDRLRIVLTYALPEQFICKKVSDHEGVKILSLGSQSANLVHEIDPRSALFGNPGEVFLCLQRIITRDLNGLRRIILSGLVKTGERWLGLRNASTIEVASEINEMLRVKNIQQGSTRSRVFFDVRYPLGSVFKININSQGNRCLGEQLSRPEPFIPVLSDGKYGFFMGDNEENPEDIFPEAGWDEEGGGVIAYDLQEEAVGDPQENIPFESNEEIGEGGFEGSTDDSDYLESFAERILTTDYKAAKTIQPVLRWEGNGTATETALVVDYEISDSDSPVLVVRSSFEETTKGNARKRNDFSDRQRIRIKNMGFKQLPNGEKALSVQDITTGQDFILDANNITFWGRWDIVDKFKDIQEVEAEIRMTPEGVPRITLLPILEKIIQSFIEKNRSTIIEGEMIQKSGKFVYLLIKPKDQLPAGIFIDGRLELRQGTKINLESGAMLSLRIDDKTGKGSVTIPNPSQEFLEFVNREGKNSLYWQRDFYRLHSKKPLTSDMVARLSQFSEDRGFREAIRNLYRFSNRIHLCIPPKQEITAVQHYPPGERVKGVVERVSPSQVEVRLEKGGKGILTNKHFSWRIIHNLSEQIAVGQEIWAQVISQQDQQVFLTLLTEEDCPLSQLREGQEYDAKVIKVDTDYALAEVGDGFVGLIPKSEVDNEFVVDVHKFLRQGDRVRVKIIKVVIDLTDLKTPSQIVLSIKRVIQHLKVKIPEAKVGLLIGKKGEQIKRIRNETGARIWHEGSGVFDISSKNGEEIRKAIARIKELIAEVEILN